MERVLEFGIEPRKILYFSPNFTKELEELARKEKGGRKVYSFAELQKEEFVREKGLNERELERYLGEEEEEGVLGEGFGKMEKWRQWEVKKEKGLVPARFGYLFEFVF